MFRKSSTTPQFDLFSSSQRMFSGKRLKHYENKKGWHNLFYQQVTSRIDESIFKPLYTQSTGSPNASLRVMVAMMVLKEGQGYSDSKLYEDCEFNLLIRKALGLVNNNDTLPVESTYYLFRQLVVAHAMTTGDNLFDKVFAQISKSQSLDFEISGKRIRMDSKLLGSNIACLSRYELVHQSLYQCYKKHKDELSGLDHELKLSLEEVVGEKAEKVIYRLNSDEIKTRLKQLGILIERFLTFLNQRSRKDDDQNYKILKGVFEQQFEVSSDQVVVALDPIELSAQNIQSPYDPDAHYRTKGDQQVKGYSANVTESCDDDQLNLIAEVSVKEANASGTEFPQSGIKQAGEVFTQQVEAVHADGAYHSPDNQEFCQHNTIDLHLYAIQGHQGKYTLKPNMEGTGIASITDNQSSKEVSFKPIVSKKGESKWRIRVNKNYRYFTLKDLQTVIIRKKVAETPKEILQKRNNVEATIFQLSYHCSGGKTKYRGIVKHQMWADMRCLWINFVRIKNYLIDSNRRRVSKPKEKAVIETPIGLLFAFQPS